MKPFILLLVLFVSIVGTAASCSKSDNDALANEPLTINEPPPNNAPIMSNKIKITVNSQTFTATLVDTNSANNFKEKLPMTITMVELNGNEKYYNLAENIPTNSSNPGMIQNGDLMLYGSNTLVLFYKTFSTSYSYTKLGSIDDATGLASALGSGNVTVSFEMQSKYLAKHTANYSYELYLKIYGSDCFN